MSPAMVPSDVGVLGTKVAVDERRGRPRAGFLQPPPSTLQDIELRGEGPQQSDFFGGEGGIGDVAQDVLARRAEVSQIAARPPVRQTRRGSRGIGEDGR